MKILGTGLNGLIGSRIVELLSGEYEFENISRSNGIDITNESQVLQKVGDCDSPLILHLAGKTDVDACEKDKELGEEGEAWKINVFGTKNILKAAEKSGKKLIYISTDLVFDGKKNTQEGYTEEDKPSPVNWYAQTKYEGEKLVQKGNAHWIIVRIAYPYRAIFEKKDFVRVLIDKFEQKEKLYMIKNHIMSPTFIDDVAGAIDTVIKNNLSGIYHAVGSQFVSPYDAAVIIASEFSFDKNLIEQTSREEFFRNRAERPFFLGLKNDKIEKFGVKMKSFEEGIKEIKRQLKTI